MGYYTEIEIQVVKGDISILPAIAEYLRAVSLYSFEIQPKGVLATEYPIKWLRCDDDMVLVSEQFPNHLFAITGICEKDGDRWRAAYLNGEQVWGWGGGLEATIPKVPEDILDLAT